MALKHKGSWLVVLSAAFAVTAFMWHSDIAAVAQEASSRRATAFQVRTRAGNVDKKPLRFIKDPNPAWSSIAVNPENGMVVMTDENLYRIVEYSRLDNTPPTARLTEPKRVIGGDQTRTETGFFEECAGKRGSRPAPGHAASHVGHHSRRNTPGTLYDDSVPVGRDRLPQEGGQQ